MALLTPTVTCADDRDGTGSTATVAGSTAGTTNTVQYRSVAFAFDGTDTWVSGGNVSGDGVISNVLPSDWQTVRPKGIYRGRIESAKAGETTVYSDEVLFAVTNETLIDASGDSFAVRCIHGVWGRILDIADLGTLFSAGGYDSTHIVCRAMLTENIVALTNPPGLMITFSPSASSPGSGDNQSWDEDVPVDVLAYDKKGPNSTPLDVNEATKWLEIIKRRCLRFANLVGVSEQFHSTIDTTTFWDRKLPEFETFLSGFTVSIRGRLYTT